MVRFLIMLYFKLIIYKLSLFSGLWNDHHVAKSINPSDVNLIIKKKSKTYSFVRSKYGNLYAESSSPSSSY